MPVTLKQIAERSGLSFQTVSKILNNQAPSYRAETREHVLRVAEELGYRPHSSARATRTGRFGSIALVRSTVSDRSTVFEGLLSGIEDTLAEHDLHLMLARLSDQVLGSSELMPKFLRQWTADGLLINYHMDIPAPLQEILHRYNLPSIWINSQQASDCVRPDDFGAGRMAAEHLLGLGHQRIAYAVHGTRHYSAADRWEGCREAMRAAGLPERRIEFEGDAYAWAGFWREELTRPSRPTAVIAYMPHIAQGAFYAALTSGMHIPKDLSLITFAEHVVEETALPLTTYLLPSHAMGRSATEMLVQKIADPQTSLPAQLLPFDGFHGLTCASPPT
ncbi:LacI family transcriptional regulator [Capsulimonas corticalis]|uniref:LacI family transcriptional regulator n=1 Tax=Capsulimonas corticalis TaxID=2219043 RepID=A0A402D5Y6_9BACT|nr:LacI family DNA-binding transcriptional regulator [Capsulimonas corticalis]BDI32497.1 LacI family transcriptional regulator [Capsulimonas corticalis]